MQSPDPKIPLSVEGVVWPGEWLDIWEGRSGNLREKDLTLTSASDHGSLLPACLLLGACQAHLSPNAPGSLPAGCLGRCSHFPCPCLCSLGLLHSSGRLGSPSVLGTVEAQPCETRPWKSP